MPIYEYKCDCGNSFEIQKSMSLCNVEEKCECGLTAKKQFPIPFIIGDTCSVFNHALNKHYESKAKMEKEASEKGMVGLTTSSGRSMVDQMKEEKNKKKKEKDEKRRKELRKHFDKAQKECHHLKEA